MWTDPITLTTLAGSSIALAVIAKRLTGRARAVAAAALVVVAVVAIWRTRSQHRQIDTLEGDRDRLCLMTRRHVDGIITDLSFPSTSDADRARIWHQLELRIGFVTRDLLFCLGDRAGDDCYYVLTRAREQDDPDDVIRQVQIVADALESVGHCGQVQRKPYPRPAQP
jgi:hypothetical protein